MDTVSTEMPRSLGNVYNPKPVEMPNTGNAIENKDLERRAIEIACDVRFHRSFTLSADPSHGREKQMRVTYSDCGRQGVPGDGVEQPVILVAGGMFGGRYLGVIWDEMAKLHGIRIVAVDRPGVGGTGRVPLEIRIATWLDIVPALLDHLDVKYVSLVSHSAGTMYSLSVVMSLRHILHPDRPFIALFGPWVPPQYSKKWTMQALRVFPAGLISHWDSLAAGVHQYVAPSLTFCSSGVNKALGVSGLHLVDDILSDEHTQKAKEEKLLLAVQNIVTDYIFNEDIQGASEEALLCLGKGKTNWHGLSSAIQKIGDSEQSTKANGAPLRIQVYYGEDDEMIGPGGESYLDGLLEPLERVEVISLDRFKVAGTDHNSVLHPQYEAPVVMMEWLSRTRQFQAEDWKFCKRKT